MENSIKTIKEIEKTHKGVGIPLLFANIASLADTSVFFIAEKGVGKGTIIKNAKAFDVNPRHDMPLFSINIVTLFNEFYNEGNGIKDIKMMWRVDEWSTLKEKHKEMFLTLGAELITDHHYMHTSGTNVYQKMKLKMENITLVALVGIQPFKYSKLVAGDESGETWSALTSDRFIKFPMINPLRIETVQEKPEYNFTPISNTHTVIPIESSLAVMKMSLNHQVSEERLPIFCRDLLKAYCKFEGYDKATIKAEIEFKQLFEFYLQLFGDFSYTFDLDEGERFGCGAYRLLNAVSRHEGYSANDLIEYFKLYDKSGKEENYLRSMLQKYKMLETRGLMTCTVNPHYRFYTSKRVQDYFEWYRNLVK